MPPPNEDGMLFAAIQSTFENGDVRVPDHVTGPLPVVSFDQHGNAFAADPHISLPVVHRIRRPARHSVGELGDPRPSEDSRALSPGDLREAHQSPHLDDDCA